MKRSASAFENPRSSVGGEATSIPPGEPVSASAEVKRNSKDSNDKIQVEVRYEDRNSSKSTSAIYPYPNNTEETTSHVTSKPLEDKESRLAATIKPPINRPSFAGLTGDLSYLKQCLPENHGQLNRGITLL